MSGFVIGVVSSLVATVISLGGGWLASRRVRRRLVRALSRMTGTGVARVHPSQREANVDLRAELARARWVKVLAGRGNELTRDGFQQVWRAAGGRIEHVRILLPDPGTGTDSWLGDREAEMARLDTGFHEGLLAEQVAANVRYLRNIAQSNDRVEVRLYDLPHVARIVVTDRVAYLTVYGPDEHGRNSPCMVLTNPGPLYDLALRMFTTAWVRSRPDPGRTPHGAGSHTQS